MNPSENPERRSFAEHRAGGPVIFAPQRADHTPPQTLVDAELAVAVISLRRKLHSAKRSQTAKQIAVVIVSVGLLAVTLTLLWFGPEPFLERVFRHSRVATTYDVFLWWLAVLVLAVAGGLSVDQLIRGRMRLIRGWKHRVADLERRLSDAEHEQRRRAGS